MTCLTFGGSRTCRPEAATLCQQRLIDQRCERETADPEGGLFEEVTGDGAEGWLVYGQLFLGDRLVEILTGRWRPSSTPRARLGFAALAILRGSAAQCDDARLPCGREGLASTSFTPVAAWSGGCTSGNHPAGQAHGGFERRRIVEQRQRLQWRVRADPAHRAELAARRVECHEARERRRPTPAA